MAANGELRRHYETILILWCTLIVTIFAFVMYRFSIGFQLALIVAAVLLFVWVFRPLPREEAPCGAAHGSEHLVGNLAAKPRGDVQH